MRTLRLARWMVSQCRSCDAAVVWAAHMETGKSQPIDAEPAPDSGGNVRLVRTEDNVHPRYVVLTDAEREQATDAQRASLHTSHFATCPDAAGWRK